MSEKMLHSTPRYAYAQDHGDYEDSASSALCKCEKSGLDPGKARPEIIAPDRLYKHDDRYVHCW